jgi:template-activating factor I
MLVFNSFFIVSGRNMKRVLDQALSLISPNRKDSKRPRSHIDQATSKSDVLAHLDSVERLQSRLLSIDKECSKEQMAVQRRFDEQKLPLLKHRADEILRIPCFWMTAIGNHPATDQSAFLKDRDILAYLESIELEDNIDDNGSYILRFIFDSNPYFPESELVRKVTINDDQTDQVESTSISWAPRKRPTSNKSIFSWFCSKHNWETDFGEVLRRDLWQNPYPYYLNVAPYRHSND